MNHSLLKSVLYFSIFVLSLSGVIDMVLWLRDGYMVPSFAISFLAFAYVALLAVLVHLERFI
ncbi:MAG: hypothetical protein QXE12_06495 [Conexivisphaerales archaeon]